MNELTSFIPAYKMPPRPGRSVIFIWPINSSCEQVQPRSLEGPSFPDGNTPLININIHVESPPAQRASSIECRLGPLGISAPNFAKLTQKNIDQPAKPWHERRASPIYASAAAVSTALGVPGALTNSGQLSQADIEHKSPSPPTAQYTRNELQRLLKFNSTSSVDAPLAAAASDTAFGRATSESDVPGVLPQVDLKNAPEKAPNSSAPDLELDGDSEVGIVRAGGKQCKLVGKPWQLCKCLREHAPILYKDVIRIVWGESQWTRRSLGKIKSTLFRMNLKLQDAGIDARWRLRKDRISREN